jgi:DNA invertase Pin-like site-specific DNA recombinase
MTIYGYQRVSTAGQKLSRQTDELLNQGIAPENIYTDKDSGGKVHRNGLDELLSKVQPGDKVVVMSFDRLARSVSQLLSISEDFQSRGIELVSVKEQIDTTSPCGKLFFTITAAFAQFEKDMNNERTKQGLEAAKKRGAKLGRPKANQESLNEAVRLYKEGNMTMRQISNATGISPSPIYRELKRLGITKPVED